MNDKRIKEIVDEEMTIQNAKKLPIVIEALEELISAQEQLWTSTNGRGLLDKAMDKAKKVLLEI